ncbi:MULTISPECIES: helix-turn-helix domain-containing protein [Rhodopseudomonas]|uniref:Transcriptional regulator n=1 Tax=Rhodopseudomonas palustris TaxID=1076 RepID=A0A0D7EVA7_RHOPL|nr:MULTISPECIES: helix-turn-helix domain-containing protein [Rhodopseudomonas]KIZ44500.1 transcriptional regulator [Rhodopseudomonas palustris]MDF3811548.1 helix-turn-helix domain-containing protein [Rhodopseudomonas sp. BAL398]WOK20650.1 helix-turn-helix domain-containing protein [Rhodopseudomonas sp. BAL398]
MADMVGALSTFGLTPRKQIQCWTDALFDLCGRFEIDPLQAASLEARISYATVSRLKLCRIEVSQHRVVHPLSRATASDHPYVKILFQTHGVSYFEQDGRHIELMPGDGLAYDVQSPHTIVSPALTRHDVVIVPKELLRERGFRSARMPACKLSARAGAGRIAHDFVRVTLDEATKLSPRNALGVADSLIDLLLLPLRDADIMADRVGPEAMYLRAQGFIREHLRDPELCIDQISMALGCTKRYLHMLFSDRGMTVSDFIWQARLHNCRQELETQPGKSVTDVAFSWGFSSSSHFSRLFRKYFGVVPSSIHKIQHHNQASKAS